VDDAPTFGAMLRAAREARGWSITDFARAMFGSVNHRTLPYRWECGTHRPTARSVERIADVLGVSEEERAALMRCAFVPPQTHAPWSESHRRAHFVARSLRAHGRCRLSDYRLRLGLTGAELARRCGVSASDICAIETGRESPRRAEIAASSEAWTETAQRIADCLGVTCAWLWPEHAPATPRLPREETPTPEALYADAEMREVVRAAVAALPPRERAVIVRRFGLIDDEEATLDEIGPHVGGVSRERVRQLEACALRELRRALRNAASRET
jgi:RNA polymerase sigma factor (sigma-70 family)